MSVEVFNNFISYNKINYDESQYISYNIEIREKIINGEFDETTAKKIYKYIEHLAGTSIGGSFVVRSSALSEDSLEHSMAGFFESYIDLKNKNDIELSIKKCYASLFSDRVIHYYFENGLSLKTLQMGVIIQQYIAGEQSGVVFTADPISMNKNVISIGFVSGGCNEFVDAKLPTSTYLINKTTGIIIKKSSNSEPISNSKVEEILKKSQLIEEIINNYADIEWTIKDNCLFILQARPITTFCDKNVTTDWHNIEGGDFLWEKAALKPYKFLMQDILKIRIENEALSIKKRDTILEHYKEVIIKNGFPYSRKVILNDFKRIKMKHIRGVVLNFESRKDICFSDVLKEIEGYKVKISQYNKSLLDKGKAVEYLNLAILYIEYVSQKHSQLATNEIYIDLFREYCKTIGFELNTEDFFDLLHKKTTIATERNEIIKMANIVKKELQLYKIFCGCSYDEIVLSRLKRLEKAKVLTVMIDKYIEEYKYAIYDDYDETELTALVNERPDYLVRRIRQALKIDYEKYRLTMVQRKQNKERIIAEIVAKIDEAKKSEFLRKLDLAEKAFLEIDDHHFYMSRIAGGYLRESVVLIANLLLKENRINSIEDIQYLTLDEIKECLFTDDCLKDLITKRNTLLTFL